MHIKVFILASAVSLLTAAIAPAITLADSYTPSLVGQVGGVTNVTAYDNGQLYFNVGPRIARMAVSAETPAAPTKPETYGGILPGIPQDIKIANGYLYLALGYGGVAVVDEITLQPLSVQSVPSTTFVSHVAVGASMLYAAAGYNGILQYNLGGDNKTLSYNTVMAFTSPARNVTDVETHGSGASERLYASADNSAPIPANRGGVLRFNIGISAVLQPAEKIKGLIDVEILKVTDTYVFAGGDDTFYVLDSAGLGDATFGSVAIGGPASSIDIGMSNPNNIFLVSSAGIDVIDVSTPGSPVIKTTSSIPSTLGFFTSLTSVDFMNGTSTILYVADLNSGLTIASSPHVDPKNVTVVSSGYVSPKTAVTSAAEGAMHQAFTVSDAQNVITFNTSTANVLSRAGAGLGLPATVEYLTAYKDLLLASDGAAGLLLYQINPSAEPTLLDTYTSPSGTIHQAVVAWPNAVIADGTNGMLIINISGTMSLVGSAPGVAFDSDYTHVAVQGNYAYLSDANGTFRIYNITDPTAPVYENAVNRQGILDIKVSGNYAYLAAGNAGVVVVDVTYPLTPTIDAESGYDTPGVAQDLAIYNDRLYVADGRFGVDTLRIDPNGELVFASNTPTPADAVELAIAPGDGLYVADTDAGLLWYRTFAFSPIRYYMPIVMKATGAGQ
jgi:hypothetical protein